MTKNLLKTVVTLSVGYAVMLSPAFAQVENERQKQKVRTVSIPISIYTKEEIREGQMAEYVQADRLIVREDREEQTILSIRSVTDAPLALAILIQEDLVSNFNLQIRDLAQFVPLFHGARV